MSEQQDQATRDVVGYALSARDSDRGAAARLRAGLNRETEHRAYADVLPLLPPGTTKREESAYLRAAALVASYPKIGQLQDQGRPIGATFRAFSTELAKKRSADDPWKVDARNPDGVALRLGQLPDQDTDSAALTLNRLLAIGDGLGVQIDYFDLARTLLRWGHGATEASIEARRKPLRDYYRYTQKPLSDKESK